MRGISVWLFSKIVMLVFLIATFSTVIGFLRLTNERVEVDTAEALAMQIKDAVQTTLHTNTVSSQAIVPVPKTIPESGGSFETGKLKPYTIVVNKSRDILYVAIGWGTNPVSYIAASSFMVDSSVTIKPSKGVSFFSQNNRYFKVTKESTNTLCFQNCTSFEAGCSPC